MARKILIVEDDIGFYNLCSAELKLKGYDVLNVSDGFEAVSRIKEEAPDLVLLDIVMPGRSGLEILEELRTDPAYENLKVVMLTNYGDESNVSKSLELGAADYLMKYKIVPSELPDKIGAILGDTTDAAVTIF